MGLTMASIAGDRRRLAAGLALLTLLLIVAGANSIHHDEQVREAFACIAAGRTAGEPVLMREAGRAELMAEYYALGTRPIPLAAHKGDPAGAAAEIGGLVGDANGFWLVIYDIEGKELRQGARQWAAANGFQPPVDRDFIDLRVQHFRRAAAQETSPSMSN
jgi:hypothetical protein